MTWNWSERCYREKSFFSPANFSTFYPVVHYNRLFFPESICVNWRGDLQIYFFHPPPPSIGSQHSKMCVFIFHESKLPSNLFLREENRKTVCFLLFSKLLFTHFRYSINLIAVAPFRERAKISTNNFSSHVCHWNCFGGDKIAKQNGSTTVCDFPEINLKYFTSSVAVSDDEIYDDDIYEFWFGKAAKESVPHCDIMGVLSVKC